LGEECLPDLLDVVRHETSAIGIVTHTLDGVKGNAM
jgi:hypothetical protein